jgi:hypothetical protein
MGIVIRKPKAPEARRMFEELEKERKARPKAEPRPKVQMTKREPLDIHKLISTISKIWDVQDNELLPKRDLKNIYALLNQDLDPSTRKIQEFISSILPEKPSGRYNLHTHEIEYDSRAKFAQEIELLFAISNLLLPQRFRQNRNIFADVAGFNNGANQRDVFLAHSSKLISETRIKNYRSKSENTNGVTTTVLPAMIAIFLGSNILAPVVSAKPIAKYIEHKLIGKETRTLYDTHGLDGLLLYMVFPPRVIGTLETIIWRKKMVEKYGLLEPNSGLTPRGIEFIRKVLPKEEILRRLAEMKANRQKAEAQAKV